MSKPRHRRNRTRFGSRAHAVNAAPKRRQRKFRWLRHRRLEIADREALAEVRAA